VSNEEVQRIMSDLALLRSRGSSVFGGEAHKFKLKPAMDERSLRQFEASHGVSLPSDYRTFLTHIGSGGAGPYYGLFDFGWMDHNHTVKRWHGGDGFVGVLHQPFPYTEHWNDLTGRPDSEFADSQTRTSIGARWRLLRSVTIQLSTALYRFAASAVRYDIGWLFVARRRATFGTIPELTIRGSPR
jgi:hypothetical protein